MMVIIYAVLRHLAYAITRRNNIHERGSRLAVIVIEKPDRKRPAWDDGKRSISCHMFAR